MVMIIKIFEGENGIALILICILMINEVAFKQCLLVIFITPI